MILSPIIYLCSGLLTNLEDDRVKGSWRIFAFLRPDWPAASTQPAFTLFMALLCLPLVLVAAFILVAFVGWGLDP